MLSDDDQAMATGNIGKNLTNPLQGSYRH